jgi:hypothetical protein
MFPMGNIAEALLKKGLAKINDRTIAWIKDGLQAYREAER